MSNTLLEFRTQDIVQTSNLVFRDTRVESRTIAAGQNVGEPRRYHGTRAGAGESTQLFGGNSSPIVGSTLYQEYQAPGLSIVQDAQCWKRLQKLSGFQAQYSFPGQIPGQPGFQTQFSGINDFSHNSLFIQDSMLMEVLEFLMLMLEDSTLWCIRW